MGIIKPLKLIHSYFSTSRSWILGAYMIMVVYLVIDGVAFMGSRYSGRISTMFCRPNDQGHSVCTFTIHGFTETFQRKFLAKNIRRVIEVKGFPGATSDSYACGIDIYTTTKIFNFVHLTQNCDYRISNAVDKIVDLFSLGESSPTKVFIYVGFHFSIFRRVFLLVIGLFIVLWWGKSWSLIPAQKKSLDENNKDYPKWFASSWLKINVLLKAFFYLSAIYIQGILLYGYTIREQDFMNRCYIFFRNYDFWVNWPVSSLKVLFCLYPLIAFAILQAYIQWKFLREMIPISGWWIGAPIIACLTLIFDLPADITCRDCGNLKYLLSGVSFGLEKSPIAWKLVFYLLLVGFVQWLVLRKRLSNSSGWIFMPLINVSIVPIFYVVFMHFDIISAFGNMLFLIILLPVLLTILGDVVTSVFLSRVMYSNKKGLLMSNSEY